MNSTGDRPQAPKGSIRAARERAEAARARPDAPTSNLTISRPIQMPRFPLADSDVPSPVSPRSRKATPPHGTSPSHSPGSVSPPRPERPRNVPSMLDGSRIQEPVPVFHSVVQSEPAEPSETDDEEPHHPQYLQARQWEQGNVLLSPGEPSTPGAGLSGASISSRPSTQSSFGSIPDFPVPDLPQASQGQGPPRRSIGPPPSSRRGVSSYYSHNSYVAPIPEEGSEGARQHESFASSHAVPKSWGDGPMDYYMDAYDEDDEDFDGAESHDARSMDAEDHADLVRKASLGRQLKPSLTTVRSNGSANADEDEGKAFGRSANAILTAAAAGGMLDGAAEHAKDGITIPPRAYVGPHVEDGQMSGSQGTPALGSPRTARSGTVTPKNVPTDPRVRQILGGLEKGGAIGDVDDLPPSAIRRPPRLDMMSVREAESRGSITSLPDLIKRATKLASNLDKGRTASRLGMLEMLNTSDPQLLNKLNQHREMQLRQAQQRGSTISGMLDSFPNPILTPTQTNPDQTWGSPSNSHRELMTPISPFKPEEEPRRHDSRRCCGMPAWLFTLLLIILIIVIAAAIIIPVLLIVIPRSQQSAAPTVVDLSKCATENVCANGGTSVVAAHSCRCVCANGFSGSTCGTASDGSCAQTDVDSYKGATMGNSLTRLFGTANTFQIPLNATAILSTFAAANLSCSSENSLMTFDGSAARRRFAARAPIPQVVTSNGIVLATVASTGQGALPTAATVSGTGTAPPSATGTTGPSGESGADDDFARVAVLWILQESMVMTAAWNAQQILAASLQNGNYTKGPINAGAGVSVDFKAHTVSANGTTVGA